MAAQADGMDPRHLEARLPVPPPRDELQRLAVAFNALLDRLSTSVNAQRRFMADASHELRTPVSVARTAAQVTLSAAHRSEPEYREALDIVASQTGRLTHVVDDMFLLALADVDGRPLVRRHLYFDEVVAECVRAAGVLAESRGISITLESPEGVQVHGDEELLRRMVMNLLDNGVRYSPAGGRVEMKVDTENGRVTFSVQDSGPGIPASAQDQVFERFIQTRDLPSDIRRGFRAADCQVDRRTARRRARARIDVSRMSLCRNVAGGLLSGIAMAWSRTP